MAKAKRFTATVTTDSKKRIVVPIPFDPDEVWGAKAKHRVGGSLDGCRIRAVIEADANRPVIVVTPSWRRERPVEPGDKVKVELTPEGPQRDDLASDVADALAANPKAGAFFDSLAQFYRRAYLRWIDATKRKPDERVARIAQMVELCERGIKERPRG